MRETTTLYDAYADLESDLRDLDRMARFAGRLIDNINFAEHAKVTEEDLEFVEFATFEVKRRVAQLLKAWDDGHDAAVKTKQAAADA